LSVLYLDLDGFKAVNDRFGHKAGDRVLVECAQRMRDCIGLTPGVIARIGGDEFVVALEGLCPEDLLLTRIAARLVQSLQEPIEIESGVSVRIGASLGISTMPRHGVSRRELLHAADEAMYEVKRSGKNAFAVFVEDTADVA
jgi:diguanylate cyclase (GGDEF)-like protein